MCQCRCLSVFTELLQVGTSMAAAGEGFRWLAHVLLRYEETGGRGSEFIVSQPLLSVRSEHCVGVLCADDEC